jgi:Na+-driven multidrug efflux pump
MIFALTLQMIEQVGIACLIGAGDTVTGMLVMSGVTLLNLPLAWGFFVGFGSLPRLGFVGIATGTAVSHALGGLVVLAVLARGRAGLRIIPAQPRPDVSLMRRILRVSIPAGVDSLSVMAGQFVFLSIVNQLGDAASAAHGIALRWEGLGYMSGNAFAVAAMTLVGQNLGAGKPGLAAKSVWTALALGGGIMCFMGLVFFALAVPMFELFCPKPEQAPVVAAGVPVLRLVAFAMPAAACTIVLTGFLGVRIPLAYYWAIHEGLGLLGAWWAMFADLTVRGLFFYVRVRGGRWKRTVV